MSAPNEARPPAGGGFLAAIGFLTCLGGARAPTRTALLWFPVVGAGIGAAVGLVWWSTASWWSLAIAAALALVADAVLTGILHLDGLADSADGLLPPVSRPRRLEIMRDPRSGAFALVAVVLVVLLRFAALTSMQPDAWAIASIAAIWCASRTVMALAAVLVP